MDQYDEWADEVCAKLREMEGKATEQDFHDVIAAGLRGAAIEILNHADVLIANAARVNKSVMRQEGANGARRILQVLSMGIKKPPPRDLKKITQ